MRRHMRSAPRFLAALFALVALFAAFAPAASARRAPTLVEAEVLQRINDVRGKAGRPAMKASPPLATLAGRHSAKIARAGTLVHAPYGRILRAVDGRCAGEVIAIGATPAEIMGGWLGSPVHRQILLDRRFTMAGVGVAPGQLGGGFAWYVTVDVAG
jgi:uncharacterized protein YkwD